MLRSRIIGSLASLNFYEFSATSVSHDRRVEIGNSTNALYHLSVHDVYSIRRGAAGVFPVTTRFIANFIFYFIFSINTY